MAKFYVHSGNFYHILERENHGTAAMDAFRTLENYSQITLGKLTMVSEQGFELPHDDDVYFDTLNLLSVTEQLEEFV